MLKPREAPMIPFRKLSLLACALLVFAVPSISHAQARTGWYRGGAVGYGRGVVVSPYAWGPRYGGYGYGGYGTGLGDAIRAQGEYNVNTSEAMINYEEARSKYIENSVKWLQAYQERQRMGQAFQEEKYAKERAAREKFLVANRESSAPPRLGPTQLDPSTGKISWPSALMEPEFVKYREKLEELYGVRSHTSSSSELARAIRETTRGMQALLKDKIRDYTPNEYIEARKFLDSLSWEGQFAAGA